MNEIFCFPVSLQLEALPHGPLTSSMVTVHSGHRQRLRIPQTSLTCHPCPVIQTKLRQTPAILQMYAVGLVNPVCSDLRHVSVMSQGDQGEFCCGGETNEKWLKKICLGYITS